MANKYQLVVVLSAADGEEKTNALIEQIKAKVESGATIDVLDNLGMKKLAYEIEDQKEAVYVKIIFTAESDFPKEIERVLKITDGVLRYLTVRVDE
jgi:small subunit ribosomal protein S6